MRFLLLGGVSYALVLAVVLLVVTLLPNRYAMARIVVAMVGLALPWGFVAFVVAEG